MRIIIYGAGDWGRRLLKILKRLNIKADYFCQTSGERECCPIEGLPVISSEKLVGMGGDMLILIAVRNEGVSRQIKASLTNRFFDKVVIYECGKFIEQNLYTLEKTNYCLGCDSYVDGFEPDGVDDKFFKNHHIIGGGRRENAICPYCGCLDRERWGIYVLSNFTDIFQAKCRVLHFAPEKGIARRIKSNTKCDYYSCDISSGRAMHMIDVTRIPFEKNIFDYIIINHVLEHISEEGKALSELMRVLKPEGAMIISFPVCTEQITIEDKKINTEQARLEHYGQKDHVRLYGYDYKERLKNYGIEVNVFTPSEVCSSEEILKYGFIKEDVLLVCTCMQNRGKAGESL